MAAKKEVYPRPKQYTPEQIDAINKGAQEQIDAVNRDSILKAKRRAERVLWERKIQRKMV
jgi:hypothetical protein